MSERQFVIFKLGNEEYATNIYEVNEIINYIPANKIPNSHDYIMGVINYRGNIIPIVDLKKKFSSIDSIIRPETRIIVMNFNGNLIGFIVDDASETLTIQEENIETNVEFVKQSNNTFIIGIAKENGRLIVLIDLSKILTE